MILESDPVHLKTCSFSFVFFSNRLTSRVVRLFMVYIESKWSFMSKGQVLNFLRIFHVPRTWSKWVRTKRTSTTRFLSKSTGRRAKRTTSKTGRIWRAGRRPKWICLWRWERCCWWCTSAKSWSKWGLWVAEQIRRLAVIWIWLASRLEYFWLKRFSRLG